jgi:hypothetical protein
MHLDGLKELEGHRRFSRNHHIRLPRKSCASNASAGADGPADQRPFTASHESAQ